MCGMSERNLTKIGAWVYDPTKNIFGDKNGRSSLFEIYCENPESCDFFQNESACLNCLGFAGCKFGRKKETIGFTKRARKFHLQMAEWKEENKEYIGNIGSPKSYNRICKMNGHYYFPYAHMTSSGLGPLDFPLDSKWVPVSHVTPALLERICTAKPRALLGEIIREYQEETIPKFISDLSMNYPELFEMLSDEQKKRLESVDYVGRKADITTCPSGTYIFGKNEWEWDGEFLHGTELWFKPTPGDVHIKIKPEPGSPVTITDNSQVTKNTRFVD